MPAGMLAKRKVAHGKTYERYANLTVTKAVGTGITSPLTARLYAQVLR